MRARKGGEIRESLYIGLSLTLFFFLLSNYIITFYAPEGTSGGILKSHHPSVCYKSCLSDISLTTEANLMKLHRKIKHNEKVCRAHDLGSYAQGQGHNQVKGLNLVSAITQKLLKQI